MISLINRLATLVNDVSEPPLHVEYVEQVVCLPDPRAYTAIERQWQREAMELEAAVDAARGIL